MTLTFLDGLFIFGMIMLSDLVSIGIVLWVLETHRRSDRVIDTSLGSAVDAHTQAIGDVSKRVGALEGWRFDVEHPEPKDPHHAL